MSENVGDVFGETEDVSELRRLARAQSLHFGASLREYMDICEAQSSEIASLRHRIAELKEALKPFAEFGQNVNADGWESSIHKESISTWFGPSDFRRARKALEEQA